MSSIERLELWTDLAPAGGTRRALVANWIACSEEVTLEGDNTMTVTLLRDNPALVTLATLAGSSNAEPQAVLRAVYGDGTFQERRIEADEERDDAGWVTFALVARGMLHELSMRGMVFREHPDGTRTYHFQASGLTAAQHITNYILPALLEAGQAFWDVGTIESTDPITIVYSADSPLAALRKLETATGLELVPPRFVAPSYRMELVTQVGASARIVRVHANVNLLATGFGRSAADVANRIYGFGADDPEVGRATMGGNAWNVTNIRTSAGNTFLTLEDPAGGPGPVAFDHQFGVTDEGQHRLVAVNAPEQADFYIVDSFAETQEVQVVVYKSGLVNTARLYRIMHGNRSLAYVEHPESRASLGPRVGYAEKPQAEMALNHIGNPLCRLLADPFDPQRNLRPGGIATWLQDGNVATTLETNPIYWRTGGRSLRCTFSDSLAQVFAFGFGAGFSDGLISYFGDIWVLEGQVEVSLTVSLRTSVMLPNNTQTQQLLYPIDWQRLYPTLPDDTIPKPVNTGTNGWERVGLEGIHDATTYPASAAWVQFRAKTLPCTVLIDAAQVTNTPTQRDLVEGTGSNALVQAANDKLARYAELGVTLGIEALDASTTDDPRFPVNNYVIGGRIQVYNERLAQAVQTRVLGLSRVWEEKTRLRVQISSARADVARILAQRGPTTPAAAGV